ncbi:MAG: hypothetical protein CM1200mP25_1570 [Acidobacteriota bacterium]|nr:MAG: hypothetical protein CM1200mP25_1570 [Acidobacteriota bacterium]
MKKKIQQFSPRRWLHLRTGRIDPLGCMDAETGELKWKGGRYGYGQLLAGPRPPGGAH